jgi:hypothetical protein
MLDDIALNDFKLKELGGQKQMLAVKLAKATTQIDVILAEKKVQQSS